MTDMSAADFHFIALAFREAKASLDAGGLPIGSVLARGPVLIASGHNQRVQQGDPIAHGEMDALRKAGRQKTYRDTTLYTSLSPCMMCAGTIVQFKIPRVVINDTANFGGNGSVLLNTTPEAFVDMASGEQIAAVDGYSGAGDDCESIGYDARGACGELYAEEPSLELLSTNQLGALWHPCNAVQGAYPACQ